MQSTIRTADGLELAHYLWPLDVCKAEVLLVHGLGEHLGRYPHVAAALNQAGYQVSGVDFRGHGRSPGKRGHVRQWSDYVEDLTAAANAIDGPYLLVAHSMGTMISLDFLRAQSSSTRRAAANARAVALSAPLLGVSVVAPKWKTAAAGLLSKIWPTLSLSNELDAKEICTDADVVQCYLDDPLTFHTITPRWYTEMLQGLERVNAVAGDYSLPLWLSYGEQDCVVSRDAVDAFAERFSGPHCLKRWPDGRHEIFNEPFQQQVFDHLIAWLDQQVA
jgi:lysophospholipase